ncbi:MAG: isochorismatase family protein [Pseudomonadota bacterium]
MSVSNKNLVERWLEENQDHGLPVTGFDVAKDRTALVVVDPQKDFLHPEGVAWAAVGQSVTDNDTVANIERLMQAAVSSDTPIVVSPHYYYPTDHKWAFEGTLEKLMHSINMFDRKGPLNLDGFEGSGADWMDEYKPYLKDGESIICSPHKVYGPENNDLVLQLQKRRIDRVVLAGMSANLCVESHLRELLECGFEVTVVADATAAAQVPGHDGMLAALVNYRMLASDVWTTENAVSALTDDQATAMTSSAA